MSSKIKKKLKNITKIKKNTDNNIKFFVTTNKRIFKLYIKSPDLTKIKKKNEEKNK